MDVYIVCFILFFVERVVSEKGGKSKVTSK